MVDTKRVKEILTKYDRNVEIPASDLLILLGVCGAFLKTREMLPNPQMKIATETLNRCTKILYG